MKPVESPSFRNDPQADAPNRSLAEALWGASVEPVRRIGAGKLFGAIYNPAKLAADQEVGIESGRDRRIDLDWKKVLAGIRLPSDAVAPETVACIHRRGGSRDVYFLAHEGKATRLVVTLRCAGRLASIWNPQEGTIVPAKPEAGPEGTSRFTLDFAPNGSLFVVFE